jgi:hypothetical protein
MLVAYFFNPAFTYYRFYMLKRVGRNSVFSRSRLAQTLYMRNKSSTDTSFSAKKHFDVLINSHIITVVLGSMINRAVSNNRSGIGWTNSSVVLFALATKPDSEWFKMRPDLLTLYAEDTNCSIFWINKPRQLKKEMEDFQHAPPAGRGETPRP